MSDAERGASNAVELSSLRKRFGARVAVDGLDLTVPRGAVAGFVGPNGAGKTTTLRVILGLLRPSGGSGTVLGCPLGDPAAYLPRVGAVIDAPAFYPGLSGSQNLRWLAAAGRLDPAKIPVVLERVGLASRAHDAYRAYSMGMKQRLGIAAALLGDPELLILDEPTNGLDPSGIHDMRTLVRSLSSPDLTVFLSSHQLSEVEEVCDWITMIDRGRHLYEGPTRTLLARVNELAVRPSKASDMNKLVAIVTGMGKTTRMEDSKVLIAADGDLDVVAAAVNRAVFEHGIDLVEIHQVEGRLERTYLNLVAGNST